MKDKATLKFNNGNGAILCSGCNKILKDSNFTEDEKKALISEIKLEPYYCMECDDTPKSLSHLEIIFSTMCMLAGADYNTVDRTAQDWYLQYEWTPEVEKQFSDWMCEYLHKIPKAQLELYGRKYMKKKECEQAVQMFLLSYGWKMKTNRRIEK